MQGDWGTQFGMLIQYLEEDRPEGLADPSISELAISDLQVATLHALIYTCAVLMHTMQGHCRFATQPHILSSSMCAQSLREVRHTAWLLFRPLTK